METYDAEAHAARLYCASATTGLAVGLEIGYAELRFAPVPRCARNDGAIL
ncbi:MAG: hypothetical protein LBB79_09375 [Prevotellaceae bacterium]|nr:hypothetical protein [Prevotellaceae bacterium]